MLPLQYQLRYFILRLVLLHWALSWTGSERVRCETMRIKPTSWDPERPWRIWSGDPCNPCSITKNGNLISLCKMPCSALGTKECTKETQSTFKCSCKPNYNGTYCEIDLEREAVISSFRKGSNITEEVGGGFDLYLYCDSNKRHYELAFALETTAFIITAGKGEFTCPSSSETVYLNDRCNSPRGDYVNCTECEEAIARDTTKTNARKRAFEDETLFWNVYGEIYQEPNCEGIKEMLKLKPPLGRHLIRDAGDCTDATAAEMTFRGGCRGDSSSCFSYDHMGWRCRTCTQPDAVRGEKCQYIDECRWNACTGINDTDKGCGVGGTCVSRPNGKFCICPKGKLDGYYDLRNDIVVDQKCSPGGEKWKDGKESDEEIRLYQFLTLMSPFHTYRGCQINDPCGKVECKNKGEKEIVGLFDETETSFKIGDYDKMQAVEVSDARLACKCNCAKGFYGDQCQFKDLCVAEPNRCKNGGTCHINKMNNNTVAFGCKCQPGFEGDFCEILDLCMYTKSVCQSATLANCYPCRNKGMCMVDKETTPYVYSCNCLKTKYSGRWCTLAKGEIKLREVSRDAKDVTLGEVETYRVVLTEKGDQPRVLIQMDGPEGTSFFVVEEDLFILKDDLDGSGIAHDAQQRKSYIFEFPHSYSDEGSYPATATLVNGYQVSAPGDLRPDIISSQATLDITANVPFGVTCYPYTKIINLNPSRSELKRYKRSDKVEVEAVISFKNPDLCLNTNRTPEWNLYRLSSSDPEPSSENKQDMKVDRSKLTVGFPSFNLTKGVYALDITVTVSENKKVVQNVERTYFEIYYPPPKIIIDGGSDRSVNFRKDNLLDASESFDESYPDQKVQLNFRWTCPKPCDLGPWDEPVITIPKYSFLPGILYTMHLDVSINDDGDIRTSSQNVRLTGADHSMLIEPVGELPYNPGLNLAYTCNCTTCGYQPKLIFTWEPVTDGESPIARPDDSSVADIKLPVVAASDKTQRSAVCRIVNTAITARLGVRVNAPPSMGTCKMDPKTQNMYLYTTNGLLCEQFEDDDQPVTYSVYAMMDGDMGARLDNLYLLAYNNDYYISKFYLPFHVDPLKGGTESTVKLVVKVTDALGLSTLFNLTVPLNTSDPSDYAGLLEQLVSRDNGSDMWREMHNGGSQTALSIQTVVLHGLLDGRFKHLTQHDLSLIKRAMIKVLKQAPTDSFKQLQQFLSVVYLFMQWEFEEDLEYLKDMGNLLSIATKRLKLLKEENKPAPTEEVKIVTSAALHSVRRLMSIAIRRGKDILERRAVQSNNERDVLDYDEKDLIQRDYFLEDERMNDQEIDEVETSIPALAREYAQISHGAFYAMKALLDTVGERLGNEETFEFRVNGTAENGTLLRVGRDRKLSAIGLLHTDLSPVGNNSSSINITKWLK